MSHTIHTTPGFIVDSRPYGESGKVLTIFTHDFGLVTATAQGIRLEKSKLRPFIQDHSFGIFSLVRGKEFWRLTSAQEDKQTVQTSKNGQELMAKIALLLRRFLHGEEQNELLFDVVRACGDFIDSNTDLDTEQWSALESLVVFRMLNSLGYVGKDDLLKGYIASTDISKDLVQEIVSKKVLMNQHINKALKESHL